MFAFMVGTAQIASLRHVWLEEFRILGPIMSSCQSPEAFAHHLHRGVLRGGTEQQPIMTVSANVLSLLSFLLLDVLFCCILLPELPLSLFTLAP